MSWLKHTDARANRHRTAVGNQAPLFGHGGQRRTKVRNSEEFAELQGEVEAQAGCRFIQVSTLQLAQLVEAVEDGVAMQAERCRGLFDRASHEVRLERL